MYLNQLILKSFFITLGQQTDNFILYTFDVQISFLLVHLQLQCITFAKCHCVIDIITQCVKLLDWPVEKVVSARIDRLLLGRRKQWV